MSSDPAPGRPLVVAYGGGINSTAMLIGLHERQCQPDLILFSDTGGEKPETYQFIDLFSQWLIGHGFPAIRKVHSTGAYQKLEEECLARHALPSLAYGRKSCSDKYKRRPQDQFVRNWSVAKDCWQKGGEVVKAIGFDAGEPHRARESDDPRFLNWFPLIEWEWEREQCIEAIERAGLPVPMKSACFFCPANKKSEILWLAEQHPELMRRALQMEENAAAIHQVIKGLGRRFAWKDLIEERLSLDLVPDPPEISCDCFDGGDDES